MLKKSSQLLTRNLFKEQSLKRDNYTCVFCPTKTNVVVHHIIERHLFADGGYYLNNGASVCDNHHWDCEKTDISVEDVRKACGITDIILPNGFDLNLIYDKWGNIILENGRKLPGPMFFQDNVQKILKDKIWMFDI